MNPDKPESLPRCPTGLLAFAFVLTPEAKVWRVRKVCGSNIRDDAGYWTQVESCVQEHSEAKFTHGLWPDCIKKYCPEPEDPSPQNR
jgi:hypothetical protein